MKFPDAPKFRDTVAPTVEDFRPHSVAWVIQRYIEEVNPMKQIGPSHMYILRNLQRAPIGHKNAAKLKKSDVIDHCRARKASGVIPATINQDVTYLSGPLKYAGSAWDDCEDVNAGPIEAARPLLVKYQLIGKSTPRKRVPTQEELDRLIAYFHESDKHKQTRIHMVPMILFALGSTRRISEICRITYGDIDWDHKDSEGRDAPMYTVRDLKHPTKKKGNDKSFALFPELAEIIKAQPRLDVSNPHERVFPFISKSAGAAYTRAKKKLGIKNLRFHDCRRAAITRWLAILKNPHQVKLISGHETTQILERVYDASDPAALHDAVAKIQGYGRNPDSPFYVATRRKETEAAESVK